jgi:hypothetical protein
MMFVMMFLVLYIVQFFMSSPCSSVAQAAAVVKAAWAQEHAPEDNPIRMPAVPVPDEAVAKTIQLVPG